MKTAKDFLTDRGVREETFTFNYAEVCLAMQLYSDRQNKELREELQSLIKELDEVKTSHYQKLDAQLVEDVERLTEENKELRDKVEWCDDEIDKQDAEIQRLTKEVEWLKRFKAGIHSEELIKELGGMMNADKKLYESILDSPASFHFNNICNRVRTQGEELTRLRELLHRCYLHIDTIPDEELKLLKDISNALNHKP